MRVAIFGGTGFVGSYLTDALVAAGHRPVILTRPGSHHRVRQAESCDIVEGDLQDVQAVSNTLHNCEAAIYNVGILREQPKKGITFQELQQDSAIRVIEAARNAGVKRFLLMSANGVKADGTPYQQSKYRAEKFLAGTDMQWTVFRPSVIFGPPRERMEFATQLVRDIIAAPLPAPLFFRGLIPSNPGGFVLSPVHVQDVAGAFVNALETPETHGKTLPLGGPETLTWREILQRLSQAVGRRKLMLPAPALGVSAAAALLDRFDFFPITRDQISMLLEGNEADSEHLYRLGLNPTPFDLEHLGYLSDAGQDPANSGKDNSCHDQAA